MLLVLIARWAVRIRVEKNPSSVTLTYGRWLSRSVFRVTDASAAGLHRLNANDAHVNINAVLFDLY